MCIIFMNLMFDRCVIGFIDYIVSKHYCSIHVDAYIFNEFLSEVLRYSMLESVLLKSQFKMRYSHSLLLHTNSKGIS